MSYSIYPEPVIATKGPLDITWTSLGSNTANGVASVTFTGLGSYRFLRIFIFGQSHTANTPSRMRLNGDASVNYTSSLAGNSSGTSQNADSYRTTDGFYITPSTSTTYSGVIDIFDANQSIPKKVQVNTMWVDSSGNRWDQNNFYQYMGTSAISSLTFYINSGNFSNAGTAPYGFNIYGGN